MNYKYCLNYFYEIMSIVKNGYFLCELSNRRMKKVRKVVYIVLKEFEVLRDRIIVVECYGEGYNNDECIVKIFKYYDEMSLVMVVFLMVDFVIIDVVRIEGFEYFYFEYLIVRFGIYEVFVY